MMAIPILFAVSHMKVGGAQQHLLEVLRRLDRRAFTPVLYALHARPAHAYLAEARALGVEIIDGHVPESLRGPALLGPVVRLAWQLRRRRIAIVHSYLFHANVVGTLAARLARTPVALVSKRSLDVYPNRGELAACRLANRLADRVTANSEAVKLHVHRVEGCPLDRIIVIPNGIDLDRVTTAAPEGHASLADSRPVIGTIGRLSRKKGQEDLLSAAALILTRMPEVRVVLVGDGPLDGQLRRQAHDLGIDDRVRFLGTVADGARLLPLLDVYVLPSHVEGMSMGLIEAMAAGRPIVATDVGGNAETVIDGVSGLIVPPRAPDRLADAILTLLKDPDRARAMGAAARQRAREHFTVDTMVKRLERLYRERLAARGIVA
jgi:glycosyltransferase involved in cell wall biosynthesis